MIRNGHTEEDIFHKYAPIEIKAYFVEARLHEIEQMRDSALTNRVAEADNKGFKEFKKSLDVAVADLQSEVETQTLDIYNMRSDNGAADFFNSASKLIATVKAQRG